MGDLVKTREDLIAQQKAFAPYTERWNMFQTQINAVTAQIAKPVANAVANILRYGAYGTLTTGGAVMSPTVVQQQKEYVAFQSVAEKKKSVIPWLIAGALAFFIVPKLIKK